MPDCTDPEIGALLHAYELDVLPETESDRFEIHAMSCDHCFREIEGFQRQAALLRSDQEIRRLAGEFIPGTGVPERFLDRLKRYLWPDVPLFFRPAVIYLFLLCIAVPFYLLLQTVPHEHIRPVSTHHLTADRAPGEPLSPGEDEDIIISFHLREILPGKTYHLALERRDGKIVYENASFTGFDEFGTGRLLLPPGTLEPGDYMLTIADPDRKPPAILQNYHFTVSR